MSGLRQPPAKGYTLIELLIVVLIVSLLSLIAIPNLMSAARRSRYSRAAADSKTATTQAMVYAGDRNVYPTSIQIMRDAGMSNVSDVDPWGISYELSPTMTSGSVPGYGDDVYVYSKGPYGTGTFPSPFVLSTGAGGSVGFSSVYGSWTGS